MQSKAFANTKSYLIVCLESGGLSYFNYIRTTRIVHGGCGAARRDRRWTVKRPAISG